MFDTSMKSMVVSQLKECRNGGEKCGGFDQKNLQVSNADMFCNQVEIMEVGGQYYDGKDFKATLDFDDQDTRTFTFMSASQIQ